MDHETRKQEKKRVADKYHNHEKKKEMGSNSLTADDSETNVVKESYRTTDGRPGDQTSEDVGSSFESSEGDQDDSASTGNYNTISSLAALKELLQGQCGDSMETDDFFQHYFMKHCNTLPSRDSNSPFPFPERRRLSECREEDEEEERKESDPPPSVADSGSCSEAASQSSLNTAPREVSSSEGSADPLRSASGTARAGSAEWEPAAVVAAASSHGSLGKEQPLNRTVMGEKHKFLVTRAPAQLEKVLRPQAHNAHTVHFGTKGAEELRPSVRSIFTGPNLHRDKKYFISDLIEIRSSADSVIASDAEDIWIKRVEPRPKVRRAEAAVENEDEECGGGRPRAGTWGAQSRDEVSKKEKKFKKEKDTLSKKDNDDKKRSKAEPKLDAAISKSTPQSMGQQRSSSQERRGAEDEGHDHPMYQQTIHGTSGVSRRPALLDSFRGKKTDSKKHPSFMKQIRSAVQNMGQSSRPPSSPAVTRELASSPRASRDGSAIKAPGQKGNSRDGSAHQHSASDKTYYHTVMAESRRSGTIAKVMDIFRSRQPDQDAPSKRRAAPISLISEKIRRNGP